MRTVADRAVFLEHCDASGLLVGPELCGSHVASIVKLKGLGDHRFVYRTAISICTQLSVPVSYTESHASWYMLKLLNARIVFLVRRRKRIYLLTDRPLLSSVRPGIGTSWPR